MRDCGEAFLQLQVTGKTITGETVWKWKQTHSGDKCAISETSTSPWVWQQNVFFFWGGRVFFLTRRLYCTGWKHLSAKRSSASPACDAENKMSQPQNLGEGMFLVWSQAESIRARCGSREISKCHWEFGVWLGLCEKYYSGAFWCEMTCKYTRDEQVGKDADYSCSRFSEQIA